VKTHLASLAWTRVTTFVSVELLCFALGISKETTPPFPDKIGRPGPVRQGTEAILSGKRFVYPTKRPFSD
jgi:hypothetical protein